MLTPYQVELSIKAYWARHDHKFRLTAWNAYHSAGWQRAKRLPDFSSIFKERKPVVQTEAQQLTMMEALMARNK